jgi:hypothetical protein
MSCRYLTAIVNKETIVSSFSISGLGFELVGSHCSSYSGLGCLLQRLDFDTLLRDRSPWCSYSAEHKTTRIQDMSDSDDDRMDTDSEDSNCSDNERHDSPLDDTDREILDLPSDGEAYDEEMDLDDSDYDDDSGTDDEFHSDDENLVTPPPVLNLLPETKWHEGDPILRKIGLERLNDKGYINLETICTDRSFGYSSDRALQAARWRAELEVQVGLYHRVGEPIKSKSKGKPVKLDDFHRIHPIFRQDNWSSDDLLSKNHVFDKLKPVLQLATVLLEDENMVGYIFGMLDIDSHKEITLPGIKERLERKAYWFEKRDNLSKAERQTVWKDLYELGENLWITDIEMTGKQENLHGLTHGERGSIEIVLNKQMVDCVCREASPVEDAADWNPGSDVESARLRVMFNLATTLVHEVMHALWRNKYSPAYEPYYMDTRAAELGFQWEQLLYSGQIDNPTGDRGSPYVS